MDVIQANAEKSNSCTMQFQWLQASISGVKDKMKEVANLLEDYDPSTQNLEMYNKRKEDIKSIVTEICMSYCSLAHDYENRLESTKHNTFTESWDTSQLEVIDCNPESIVVDPETDHEDTANDMELEDGDLFKDDKFGMKLKFSRLLEANTELQMEFIRRNSQKREMIFKLQDEVSRLTAEKDVLKRHLSYVERNKSHLDSGSSSSRKSLRFDRFFRCSF